MKNLDLSAYGVAEMNEMEMNGVDGGIIDYIVASWGLAGRAAAHVALALTSDNAMVLHNDVCR